MAFIPVSVNFATALVAAVAAILIGKLWYNVLFAKVMKKLRGAVKPRKKTFLLTLIADVLMAYALAVFISVAEATTAADAVGVGILLWMGFVIPLKLSGFMWEKKPGKIFLIEIVEKLVALIVMSVILMV